MENHEKTHILFLGLDHRLLWQLTRTLAHLEDRIVIDCVKDPSAAKEICDRESVQRDSRRRVGTGLEGRPSPVRG